ncbi:hypothetical protein AAVH_25671 [Aphelenchoides avenae]|nr:hypothetical protein AAVH_25671 [Aphelenchus avenae]
MSSTLFDATVEAVYLNALTVAVIVGIPSHLLIIYMALFRTPRDMINYRMTVTNTTTWSLAVLIHTGAIFRPVPLFPLPVGKTQGIVRFMGDEEGGQFQFCLMMVLIANFLVASLVCFTVLCVFLLQVSMLGAVRYDFYTAKLVLKDTVL